MNQLTKMEKLINTGYTNIIGLKVMKNGRTVYENYYNGHKADNTAHIFSCTKSVLSALFGIAMEQGFIKSLDQKILEFFPDYTVLRGERTIKDITIRDMMTMTVPYKCKVEPYSKVFSSDDWITPALDIMGGKGRIGEFRYSPIIGTHVLSGVLTSATGRSVLDFANEMLFLPLEIENVQSIKISSKDKFFDLSNEREKREWVSDPQNNNTAGWGLILKTDDMAKIGQLYLDHGKYNGQRLVPDWWIQESTIEHSRYGSLPYGYLWWVINEQEHSYAAMGQGGNIIYVNERKEIVVSISAVDAKNAKDSVKLIKDFIEPTFAG